VITKHPNVDAASKAWSESAMLHVAMPYSNPFRWNARRRLMRDAIQQLNAAKNVKLYVGELAYGDRPFEVTGDPQYQPYREAQIRTVSELFHKENIVNETIKIFDPDWQYGAYCDGDFSFTRNDWALEAIHLLQHYDFVQLFSTYTNLSSVGYGGSQPGKIVKSFVRTYIDNVHQLPKGVDPSGHGLAYGYDYATAAPYVGATGGAWAFRRSAFDTVGGLLDQAILGSGDWFMAFGLVSHPNAKDKRAMPRQAARYNPSYVAMVEAWQSRAAMLKRNVGVLDQFVVHHFHGPKSDRGYGTRDEILIAHQFDPVTDIRRNSHGIYELTGNKPALRDAIRAYFIARNEDATEK
jgi:hypothetical protein